MTFHQGCVGWRPVVSWGPGGSLMSRSSQRAKRLRKLGGVLGAETMGNSLKWGAGALPGLRRGLAYGCSKGTGGDSSGTEEGAGGGDHPPHARDSGQTGTDYGSKEAV